VVHNHYGPNLLDMWNFDGFSGTNSVGGGGIYFFQTNVNLEITPYGDTRPNFNSPQVDNFVSNNTVMWLSEYHMDGFRWDDPYTLTHDNAANYISAAGNLLQAINNMTHSSYPGKISIAEDVYNTWGFDSSWDTAYPGTFTPVLTNTVDADRNMTTIANAIQYNVSYGGNASSSRVAYLESHDVVYGPNGGVRLVTAIDPVTPSSYRARKLSTLGSVVTLTAPGVPMIYQGQEMLESNAFYSYLPLDWTKTNTFSGIVQLYRDLITARRNLNGLTPGLEGDQYAQLWLGNPSKVIAFHRWKSSTTNQDAVVIANFSSTNYPVYNLNFPWAGTWYVHFNSDSTNYSSDFGNNGSTVVTASGNPATASVAIGPYSALILSQIPNSQLLSIGQTNSILTISWSSLLGGWVLDTSTTLTGSPPPWTQVPVSQYTTNATSVFINTVPSSGSSFYRLRKL
jgi:1,4-alpha-glucan branching enzyme